MRRGRWGGWTVLLVSVILVSVAPAQADDSVSSFGGNAQHTAVFDPPAQDLNAIHWKTSIDQSNSGQPAHYGAPLITRANTIIVPVKTAAGFSVSVLNGSDGTAKYSLGTDYILPSHNWIPAYQPALAPGPLASRLYYPGAGGTVFYIDDADSAGHGAPVQQAFYAALGAYHSNAAAFNAAVYVNTPITVDASGDIFFGFRVQGTAPAPLSTTQGGFARIDPAGNAIYVLAGTVAGDPEISRDSHNSAPALSSDGATLYIAVKSAQNENYGYLLGLDAGTLAAKFKVFLKDPRNGAGAGIRDDSTASPTVAPDGDVYFGVFANPDNGSRGFMLRFSGDLAVEKTPGGFGWDYTPGIVPAAMVPSYQGPSSYLIFAKYNNYAQADGNGVNKIALLDPAATQIDPHASAGGLVEMREFLTVTGPTPDAERPDCPKAVREWCINTPAINPATNSIFSPSEDGHMYRWNLLTNSLSQAITLGQGVGEPYVPTVVGPDGTVFTLNGGALFALGGLKGARITLTPAVAAAAAMSAGPSLLFTASVASANPGGPTPTGTVTFQDTAYFVVGLDDLGSTTSPLGAGVALDAGGIASSAASVLSAGSHFITATYSGDGNFPSGIATLVEEIQSGAEGSVASGIKAFPSPWRSDRHNGKPITFAGLITGSTVKIFTVSGRWVKTIADSCDEVTWNLKNDSGDPVASGLYLYLVIDPQGRKTKGMFGVIR